MADKKSFKRVESQAGFERNFDATPVEVMQVIEKTENGVKSAYLRCKRLGEKVNPRIVMISGGALGKLQDEMPELPILVNDKGEIGQVDSDVFISTEVKVGASNTVLYAEPVN